MSAITLLPGVDKHGSGYRVRLSFNGRPHIETGIPTPVQANRRISELRELRDAGLTPDAAPSDDTLRDAAEALLTRKRTVVSRKTKRKLRKRGLEWWERILSPWIDGEFAATPVSMLRRNRVEDAILARAEVAAKTAGDELYGLKATLRYARERGAKFDEAILAIESIAVARRQRHALTGPQAEYLAAHAPEYGRRMLLFKSTVGNRWRELATLTDDRVHLDEAAIFIPAHLCKEGVDKWIDLTREEVTLLREQLLARAAGSRHVFPTKAGLTLDGRYGDWHRMVWSKTVRRAAAAWRDEHDLDAEAATPFQWPLLDEDGEPVRDEQGELVWDALEPHDLRATAATLMRDAGFSREETAHRLGHADSGKLLDRLYDQGDRRTRVQRAIARHAPDGLRAQAEPGNREVQLTGAVSAAAGRGLNSATDMVEPT